jgi:hypothetical protein
MVSPVGLLLLLLAAFTLAAPVLEPEGNFTISKRMDNPQPKAKNVICECEKAAAYP